MHVNIMAIRSCIFAALDTKSKTHPLRHCGNASMARSTTLHQRLIRKEGPVIPHYDDGIIADESHWEMTDCIACRQSHPNNRGVNNWFECNMIACAP